MPLIGICYYVICIILAHLPVTNGFHESHYGYKLKLIGNLLRNDSYNPTLIPTIYPNESMPIDIQIMIGDYVEVHETSQSVMVDIRLKLSWKDALLAWNQLEYDGISSTRIDFTKIWHPEIRINFGTDLNTNTLHENTQANVTQDGVVNSIIVTNTLFRCPMKIEKFPFDQQNCTFYIFSLNALLHEAYFENATSEVRLIGGGQWDLVDHTTRVFEERETSVVAVNLILNRKPTYYLTYVILPLIGGAIINPIVFLVPIDSGERITTAVTLNLSYFLFLVLITDVLPRSSNSIPVLSNYIAFVKLMSGLYMLISVLLMRRNKKLDNNMTCCFIRRKNVVKSEQTEKETHQRTDCSSMNSDWFFALFFEVIVVFVTVVVMLYILSPAPVRFPC